MGALKTDWDEYYRRPGRFTGITRRITAHFLLRQFSLYRGDLSGARILEFGGGNSCFFDEIQSRLQPRAYTIVDRNRTGLDLFEKRHPGIGGIQLIEADICDLPGAREEPLHDICFSIGLIEHFDPTGTRAAVRAHFDWVRPGGLVILFFPTPTALYRGVRGAAERLGVWAFPDERPLTIDEVRDAVAGCGRSIHCGINWWIGLTQAFVVVEVDA